MKPAEFRKQDLPEPYFPSESLDMFNPLTINPDEIYYIDIHDLSSELQKEILLKLARIRQVVFNADNQYLMEKHTFIGLTKDEGLSYESGWSLESSLAHLNTFTGLPEEYTFYVALAKRVDTDSYEPLGASILRNMKMASPDDTLYVEVWPNDREVPTPAMLSKKERYYIMETFRRPEVITESGIYVKGIGQSVRKAAIDRIQKQMKTSTALIYSFTNNPLMKRIWTRDKFNQAPVSVLYMNLRDHDDPTKRPIVPTNYGYKVIHRKTQKK